MGENKEFTVTLYFSEESIPKAISTEVAAKSEAEAINKSKVKLSLHAGGNNYKVISGASAFPK